MRTPSPASELDGCSEPHRTLVVRHVGVVLTVDRVDALADAILIARRSKRIALQAILIGMGLSLAAMIAAAAGLLQPAAGALLQEVIDVLAIGIALRAVLPGAVHTIAMPPADVATALRLRAEHDAVAPAVEQIRSVANGLPARGCDLAPARTLLDLLEGQLLPHERADEALLVPLVARALDGTDATAAMSRTHAEIEHQVSQLHRLLAGPRQRDHPARGRHRTPAPALRAVRRAPAAQRTGGRGRVQPRAGRGRDRPGRHRAAAIGEPAPGAGPRSDVSPGTGPPRW